MTPGPFPVDAPVDPSTPLLALHGIRKTFAGVTALADASLEIRPGEVHALLGENGAGKSTLVKIIAGMHQRDAGEIMWEGEPTEIATRGRHDPCLHRPL